MNASIQGLQFLTYGLQLCQELQRQRSPSGCPSDRAFEASCWRVPATVRSKLLLATMLSANTLLAALFSAGSSAASDETYVIPNTPETASQTQSSAANSMSYRKRTAGASCSAPRYLLFVGCGYTYDFFCTWQLRRRRCCFAKAPHSASSSRFAGKRSARTTNWPNKPPINCS